LNTAPPKYLESEDLVTYWGAISEANISLSI